MRRALHFTRASPRSARYIENRVASSAPYLPDTRRVPTHRERLHRRVMRYRLPPCSSTTTMAPHPVSKCQDVLLRLDEREFSATGTCGVDREGCEFPSQSYKNRIGSIPENPHDGRNQHIGWIKVAITLVAGVQGTVSATLLWIATERLKFGVFLVL